MSENPHKGLPRRAFLRGFGLTAGLVAVTPLLQACGQAPQPAASPAAPQTPPTAGASQPTATPASTPKPVASTASPTPMPLAQATVAPAQGAVTLNYWDMQWGPPEFMNQVQDNVTAFNKANPKINVKFAVMSWGDYSQKLLSATQAGNPPDMSGGGGSTPVVMDAQGQALDLNDLYRDWKSDGTLDDMVPWAHQKWNFNGKYPGATWQFDGRAIFYRKDLFEKAGIPVPTTWEEWLAAAQKLTDASKEVYGLAVPGKQGSYDTDQFYMTLVFQAGGRLADTEGNPTFDTPEHLKALEFEKALVSATAAKGTPSWTFTEVTKSFQQGKAAIAFNGGWFIGDTQRNATELFPNVGVLPVLIGPGGQQNQKSIAFANAWWLAKNGKSHDEAKTFLKFMMKKENLRLLYAADPGNKWPVYKSLVDDPIFKGNEVIRTMADQVVKFGIDYWYPNNSAAYKLTALGTSISDSVVNPVLAGTRTPQEALKDQQTKMAALFKQKS